MGNTRKPLQKKIRFEVFKRDRFTCQYCGQSAPDVILEIDHMIPVSKGGSNDILNLITSCRDCNRGKGKIRLSENEELKKQTNRLKELQDRREQTEMMMEWRNELTLFAQNQVEKLSEYIGNMSDYIPNESGCAKLKRMVREFSFVEVCDAIDIAFNSYYKGDEKTWNIAFNKIGGICYNRRRNGDAQCQTE